MAPRLPRNVKLGQVRRTIGIVAPDEWRELGRDERDAADALALHLWWRCRQNTHPALEGEDGIFLTVKHVQRLLRAARAAKSGEKAARAAIRTMEARGWIADSGRVKRPRRPQASVDRAERFGRREVSPEGGRDAQPTISRSYWWRVFRVPALTVVAKAFRPFGAYAHSQSVPQHLASLSAFLRRQGLIAKRKRRSRPNPRSAQWVFLHSGPP